jgi:hypothetical protein
MLFFLREVVKGFFAVIPSLAQNPVCANNRIFCVRRNDGADVFHGLCDYAEKQPPASLFHMAFFAGHRSRFFSGLFFGFVALHALLVHDLLLGKDAFLLQVLNGARLLGIKIMAEHAVLKRFLVLLVRKLHVSLITGWDHDLFCPFVGFGNGYPCNPDNGGRDE